MRSVHEMSESAYKCFCIESKRLVGLIGGSGDLEKVVPGFTAAIIAEITEMLKYIPSSELAIQWDMAIENRLIEVPLKEGNLDGAKAAIKELEVKARY